MKKFIIVMLGMIVAMYCGPVSFAQAKDLDLDAPPGMYIEYPIEITKQTALRMTMKCVEIRKHDEWIATFGIEFIGEDKNVFFRFFPDPSNAGTFETYLEYWQGDKMIGSNKAGYSVSLNNEFTVVCDWNADSLTIAIDDKVLTEAIDIKINKIKLSCSTARLLVTNIQQKTK